MDLPKLCTTRLTDQNFGMCIYPQDLMLPFYNFHGTNYFRPWRLSTESAEKNVGSTIHNTKDIFKVTLDVQHFLPKEISVKTNDNEVIIEGKHEERPDDHGFISRQFIRRYVLPRSCKSETVSSTLSADGILTVTADNSFTKDIKEKIVPIKMTNSFPKKEEIKEANMHKEANVNKEANMNKEANLNKEAIINNVCDLKKETELDKKEPQTILKEDHCRLLKPELLKEAVSGTEKLLSESRKETDELLKLISSDTSAKSVTNTTGKLEEALDHCKTAIAELKEKVAETNITSSSEISNLKSNLLSESLESRETSCMTTSSITMSSMKASSEETSEFLIRAEATEIV